jgi:hypothetical protein
MRKPSIVLSIDFDFFPWRAFEARQVIKDEVSTALLFDWTHDEGRAPFLQHVIWLNRYAGFIKNKLDPQKLCWVNEKQGGVTPEAFTTEVSKRWEGLKNAPLYLADSHGMGYLAIRKLFPKANGPIKLYHFDAHHDLGYSDGKVQGEREQGRVDCASWLYHVLDQQLVREAEIIYPDWAKGDWYGTKTSKLIKKLGRRVRSRHWSDWLKLKRKPPQTVLGSFLCRSSAWVPPWCDHYFEAFWQAFPASFGGTTCLDCTEPQKIGAHDACVKREWDQAAAENYAHQLMDSDRIIRQGGKVRRVV